MRVRVKMRLYWHNERPLHKGHRARFAPGFGLLMVFGPETQRTKATMVPYSHCECPVQVGALSIICRSSRCS